MQQTIEGSEENDLIRLLLKRQSELNSLLEITRAINNNMATPLLMQMLEYILKKYLHIGRFRFLIQDDGEYICMAKYGDEMERTYDLYKACRTLKKADEPISLNNSENSILKFYDYFIPIKQPNNVLAYVLIGKVNSTDEMLSNDLNFIQTLLNVVLVGLENKKLFKERLESERFHKEMELAGEVQNMLIPMHAYNDEYVELNAQYLPHQNIGGDYFDFIRLNDDEFLWCIADVSGKGISAALLMANFQASLRALATVESDLTGIVDHLNAMVLKNTKGEKFITLFLAKYNQKNRKLSYVNAGHNPAVLYSNNEIIQLKLGSTMIGAFETLPFLNQGEIDIDKNTLIFNYTDGLIDHDGDSTEWNEDILLNCILKYGKLCPELFNKNILKTLGLKVSTKPIDDITLFTLKIF